MKLPNLDEATRTGLNELTAQEVSGSYAYNHEILWYGIEAVAHAHLMKMARGISEGKLSQEEFLEKYGLDFGSQNGRFAVPLEKMESDGIFIPQQAYWEDNGERGERRVHLFNHDYKNRVRHGSWVDKRYALELIERIWQPSDLENPELVEKGIKFGTDMWGTCVEGFNLAKKEDPQQQKVTDLGERLIAYYSGIVSEQAHSK